MHTGGVTTTWLAGAGDPRRPLDPRFAELLQATINHVYTDFTGKAAQARKTTPDKIDAVAQGRVWTGAQAKERGLVDTLGGYADALKSAAKRAQLGDNPRIVVIQPEPGRAEQLLSWLNGQVHSSVAGWLDMQVAPGVAPVLREARRELGWVSELTEGRKPFAAVAHCLCSAP